MAICKRCKGTKTVACPNCHGEGIRKSKLVEFLKIISLRPDMSERTTIPGFEPCEVCSGSGVVECPECKGTGFKAY